MAWLYAESETSSAMHRATSDYGYKTFLNSHENAESDSKMENFKYSPRSSRVSYFVAFHYFSLWRCSWSIIIFPTCRCRQIMRPTPGLVRTYGGDREMYREVATLRMLMSWTSTPDSGTLYGTRIAHRMAESGYTLVSAQICPRIIDILRQNFALAWSIICLAMLELADILLEFAPALTL